MKFRKLRFNPAGNPAVLATGTWDRAAAWRQVQRMRAVPPGNGGSLVRRGAATFLYDGAASAGLLADWRSERQE